MQKSSPLIFCVNSQHCDIDNESITKCCSLASDGASVMVGKTSGVSARLKRINPRIVNVHCICHRLALACGDANNEVKYILEIESILLQLWKYFENSCCKTAAYLKVQLQVHNVMQIPDGKQQSIARKLQRACRTRCLSTEKAISGVWQDYVAVLTTLSMEQFKNDVTGCGLLHKVKSVKFIGTVYILKFVLPILSCVSRCFQKGFVSFAAIDSAKILRAKDDLLALAENEEPLKQLAQDLTPSGRLGIILKDLKPYNDPTLHLPTESQTGILKNLLNKYVEALCQNLDLRFQESSPIIGAFRIFDLMALPERQASEFRDYGTVPVQTLATHYFASDDQAQFTTEWNKAKYDIISWRQDLPTSIRQGKGSMSAVEWCMLQFQNPATCHHYPLLSYIAEIALTTPVSNAWPERGASILKLQKTWLRSRMKNDILAASMQITINGPKIGSQEEQQMISKAITIWQGAKKRRKLPKIPHNTPVSHSLCTASTSVQSGESVGVQTEDNVGAQTEDDEVPCIGTSDSHEDVAAAAPVPPEEEIIQLLNINDCLDNPDDIDSDYDSDYSSDFD